MLDTAPEIHQKMLTPPKLPHTHTHTHTHTRKQNTLGTGGGGGINSQGTIVLSAKTMTSQNVGHLISPIGVCCTNDTEKSSEWHLCLHLIQPLFEYRQGGPMCTSRMWDVLPLHSASTVQIIGQWWPHVIQVKCQSHTIPMSHASMWH